MPARSPFRSAATFRRALVCAVILALLSACVWVAHASRASSFPKTTVQCQSGHAKRQCLERDGGLEFGVAPTTCRMFSPLPSSSCLGTVEQSLLVFRPNGPYYNRPPPRN